MTDCVRGMSSMSTTAASATVTFEIIMLTFLTHTVFDEFDKTGVELILELGRTGEAIIEISEGDGSSTDTSRSDSEKSLSVEEILFFETMFLTGGLVFAGRVWEIEIGSILPLDS